MASYSIKDFGLEDAKVPTTIEAQRNSKPALATVLEVSKTAELMPPPTTPAAEQKTDVQAGR